MSNLFERKKPQDATVKDVENALNEITEWDWHTGYSFAHIVIGDGNLGDGHILFCLEPSRIADVMNQKLKDAFGHTDFDKLEKWQWYEFKDIIRHMAEIIDLLNWLLEVPENIRDMV